MPIDQSSSEQEALGSEAETAGSLLAAARKARGLDEKQVADHLHITVHYVKAIEADLYEKLPGAIFARGYIKSYANYLGLDTEDIVSRYQALAGQQPAGPTQIKAPVTNKPRRQRNLQWALASVGVFSVVIIAAWLLSGDPEPNEAAAVNTESRLPDSSRPASPATAAESVTAGSQDVALAPSAADNSAVEEPATGQALLSSTEIGVAEAEQSVGQETVQTEAAASALAVAETETVPDTSPDTSPDISPDISPDSARADSSQGDAQAAGLAVSDTVPATPNNETAEDSVPTTVSADSTVTASTAEPVISAASTVDTANSDNVEPAQQTAAAADVQQAAVDRSAAPRPEELAVMNVLETIFGAVKRARSWSVMSP